MCSAKLRLERIGPVWERCRACNMQLVTVQDVTNHLDSLSHEKNMQRLQQLVDQEEAVAVATKQL